MGKKTTIGLDIGTAELKLVQWDGEHIRRSVRAEMPDNMVREGTVVSFEAMGDFIRDVCRREKITGRDCAVLLPAQHAYLRRVTMPAMTDRQLQVNLPYELRDFLEQSKENYFYDYAVNDLLRDESGTPTQLDLTAAAVPKSVIEEYRAMLHRAGLRLKTAIPVECSYANLLRSLDGEEDHCILDLGHGGVRLHFYTRADFETTRIIDIGLDRLDLLVADLLHTDVHVARLHKLADQDRVLESDQVAVVYQRIAADIRWAVNFYAFNNRESDLKALWYCGGGSYIAPLLETISDMIELPLRPLDQLVLPEGSGEDLLSVLGALGAAIQ